MLLAVPAVANVAGVFLLLVYIFAIVGMHMFGKMPRDGDFFNDHANFRNVGYGKFRKSRKQNKRIDTRRKHKTEKEGKKKKKKKRVFQFWRTRIS